jgi:DNA modification methylase
MYLNHVTSTDFIGGDVGTRTESPTNTVLSGDCIEVMDRLDTGSVDFILTDPPYLADYRSRDGRTIRNDAPQGRFSIGGSRQSRTQTSAGRG